MVNGAAIQQWDLSTHSGPKDVNPELIKILVVDDDSKFLFAVTRILLNAKFKVVAASDGMAGLTKARSDRPDLILMDVNMPRLNGFEVKKVLNQEPETQKIPVIFLTAMSGRDQIVAGLNLAEDYITKPFNPEIMIARLKTVLRRTTPGYEVAPENSNNPIFTSDQFLKWGQAVDARELGKNGHTYRVTRYFTILAKSMMVPEQDLENAQNGALLHDIGKLAISENILNKPGLLDSSEWEIMRQHPLMGNDLLFPIKELRPALDIVRYHHEHWDGTGYPDRLWGTIIPRVVRIFSVVHAFDCLTSDRPYKHGLSDNEALEIILGQREKEFDPAVVDHFLLDFAKIKHKVKNECTQDNRSY